MQAIGKKFIWLISIFLWLAIGTGCGLLSTVNPSQMADEPTSTLGVSGTTPTPFQPSMHTATVEISTPTPSPAVSLGIAASVPESLVGQINLLVGTNWSEEGGKGDVVLSQVSLPGEKGSTWVFALVAPFGTVADGITSDELVRIWRGEVVEGWEGIHLILAETTRSMLENSWGTAGDAVAKVLESPEERISEAWSNQPSLAIIPFEELEPRWKVLRVNEMSPLEKNFQQLSYSLTFNFDWVGETTEKNLPDLPVGNRSEENMTVITMTGVTALTRATGFMMDKYGLTYPGEDIYEWMTEADFTHVSNEVSFDPDCPAQDPNQQGLRFCSRPDYIQLLEYVGVDIVELTGNHLMDFQPESLSFSMELYRQRGWLTFGGGENIEIASQPALLEHHDNRIAFVGCNPAGPGGDWAGPGNAGSQPCDWEAFREQIRELTGEGYLVIATLQYAESYMDTPVPQQVLDFHSLSEAGAVIVSGSQAHFPQSFEFLDGKFIHYGLGNLFFDQMDYPVVGTRREFLDRHVFYDGKHISTELLTAMLENYARPRPMNDDERAAFLRELFQASGW